jgi:hypothetical protein
MARTWHNKHISTSWGIAILGFLVISLALLIPVLNQYQDIRSNAMYMSGGTGKYSCPANYIPFQIGTHLNCVGYVIRTSSGKWYCSNSPHGKPVYNKYISNCYFFPGISVNNGRLTGHQACSSGYHLYSAIKTSPANAKCIKNT